MSVVNVLTRDIEYDRLDVENIMLGTTTNDDRYIITTTEGKEIIISPRSEYHIQLIEV